MSNQNTQKVKVSNKRMRDIQRVVHLVGAVLLLAYIYSPAGDALAFERVIQAAVIPILTLTGILMWQLPRLRKMLRNRTAKANSAAIGE